MAKTEGIQRWLYPRGLRTVDSVDAGKIGRRGRYGSTKVLKGKSIMKYGREMRGPQSHHRICFGWVFLLLGLALTSPFSGAQAFEARIDITVYDPYFKEYGRRYFGEAFDWRLFKAQAIAESRLKPDAVSKDGAVGLMQLLPETFEHLVREHPDLQDDIHAPRWNIAAGIYYDRTLWNLWEADRPFKERIRFMFGAYNAGREAILQAQQIAIDRHLDPFVWNSIVQTLIEVIGPAHRETIAYVDQIFRIRKEMRSHGDLAP